MIEDLEEDGKERESLWSHMHSQLDFGQLRGIYSDVHMLKMICISLDN